MKAKFRIHDRAKTQDSALKKFTHLNPRFSIVERATNKEVDSAQSRYEARLALAQAKAANP